MSMGRSQFGRLLPARRRFGRRGTTALEFAILSIPFMLFFLFLFELGFDFYVQLALDYGVQEGARRVQTGNAQAATAQTFVTNCMCPAISSLLNCAQISVNLQPVTTDYYTVISDGGSAVPVTAGKLNTSAFGINPGAANQLMFVQAIYTSPSIVGLLLPSMSVSNGTTRVRATVSTMGFINEPFGNGSGTACT
jgi:Flp pilus assembly protein TadG